MRNSICNYASTSIEIIPIINSIAGQQRFVREINILQLDGEKERDRANMIVIIVLDKLSVIAQGRNYS